MTSKKKNKTKEVMQFTSQIVSAYLGANKVEVKDIPSLIDTIFHKVSTICETQAESDSATKPAVPVEESITPDHIICLEDGKQFKMLKKHLKTQFDMTPDQYRAKWNLPVDYPMVAPNYAIKRQALAKASGLGRTRQ